MNAKISIIIQVLCVVVNLVRVDAFKMYHFQNKGTYTLYLLICTYKLIAK